MSIHPTSRRRLTAILVAVGVTATAAGVAHEVCGTCVV